MLDRIAQKHFHNKNATPISPKPKIIPAFTHLQSDRNGQCMRGNSNDLKLTYVKNLNDRNLTPAKKMIIEVMEHQIFQQTPRQIIKTSPSNFQNSHLNNQRRNKPKDQLLPAQKKVKKIQHIPVERQIIHYPSNEDPTNIEIRSRKVLQSQGIIIKPGAQFKQLDPTLIYKYSCKSKNKPIGYIEDGCKRNLSTAPSAKNIGSNSHIFLESGTSILSPRRHLDTIN